MRPPARAGLRLEPGVDQATAATALADLDEAAARIDALARAVTDQRRGGHRLPAERFAASGAAVAFELEQATPEWIRFYVDEMAAISAQLFGAIDLVGQLRSRAQRARLAAALDLADAGLRRFEIIGYDLFARDPLVPVWRRAVIVAGAIVAGRPRLAARRIRTAAG